MAFFRDCPGKPTRDSEWQWHQLGQITLKSTTVTEILLTNSPAAAATTITTTTTAITLSQRSTQLAWNS